MPDTQTKNKYIVDVDRALEMMLEAFGEQRAENTKQLKEVYLAGDVNDDQSIGLDEFLMLFRNMERQKFVEIQAP